MRAATCALLKSPMSSRGRTHDPDHGVTGPSRPHRNRSVRDRYRPHGGGQESLLGYEVLQPTDMADAIAFAISAPTHVNVSNIEIISTMQVPGGLQFANGTALSYVDAPFGKGFVERAAVGRVRSYVRPHMMLSPSRASSGTVRGCSHLQGIPCQPHIRWDGDPNHCRACGTGELQGNGTTPCRRSQSAMPNNGDVP